MIPSTASAMSHTSGTSSAAGQEPEVDVVHVRQDGHVEPRPLHDRPHRVGGHELGPVEVEGEVGPRHVRHDHVVDGGMAVGEVEARVQAGRQHERAGGGLLGPVLDELGADGVVVRLGALRGPGDGPQPLGGVGDVGAHVHEHGGDPVVGSAPLVLASAPRRGTCRRAAPGAASTGTSRYWRRTPDTRVSTTSLTLTPKAARTRLMSLRRTRAKATERCGVMAADHGVRGARSGTAPTTASGSRWRLTRWLAVRTVRPTSAGNDITRRACDIRAWPTISMSLGMRSARPGTGPARLDAATAAVSSGGCGVRSNRWTNSSAPETPSTAAWWILPMSATLPSYRPSTTWISHRGRARSSGTPTMAPVRSVSSRGPPGAGSTWRRMW